MLESKDKTISKTINPFFQKTITPGLFLAIATQKPSMLFFVPAVKAMVNFVDNIKRKNGSNASMFLKLLIALPMLCVIAAVCGVFEYAIGSRIIKIAGDFFASCYYFLVR